MNWERIEKFVCWVLIGMMSGVAIIAGISYLAGCASATLPVYTGTEPTIYATDQAALVPEPPDPVWFDWQAPLDLEGLNFPDPNTQPGL